MFTRSGGVDPGIKNNTYKRKQIMSSLNRRTWLGRTAASLLSITIAFAIGAPSSQAKPRSSDIGNIVPTIKSISVQNGQLVASGTATAVVKGKTTTSPFTAPVTIALAEDQSAATDCPVLDLTLGPIHLDVLGLVVDTSPICLNIVAHHGEGLLGDLLCSVANLLGGGLSLDQILAGQGVLDPVTGAVALPGLTAVDLGGLLDGITGLLNNVLGNLLDAILGIENQRFEGFSQACNLHKIRNRCRWWRLKEEPHNDNRTKNHKDC